MEQRTEALKRLEKRVHEKADGVCYDYSPSPLANQARLDEERKHVRFKTSDSQAAGGMLTSARSKSRASSVASRNNSAQGTPHRPKSASSVAKFDKQSPKRRRSFSKKELFERS